MNIRRTWIVLALLTIVVLTAAIALPDSLAFISARSNTMRNTFTANYAPPQAADVEVRVHKIVTNPGKQKIGPEGFQFLLRAADGETITLTTGADGYASTTLRFTGADAGKTYTYRLTEVDDDREHVTYSDKVYTIQISLTVDAQNRIVPALRMNDVSVQRLQAEFVNVYNPIEVPDTGDHDYPLTYAVMMLLSGAALLLLIRRRTGYIIRRP